MSIQKKWHSATGKGVKFYRASNSRVRSAVGCKQLRNERNHIKSAKIFSSSWYDRLCNQTPQVPIQFIFKPSDIPKRLPNYWSGLAGIVQSLNGLIAIYSFHGFRAVTAALETILLFDSGCCE
jgi:hypothetical protein